MMGQSPFGIGFALTFGRVYKDSVNNLGDTVYYFVTPDGNRHALTQGYTDTLYFTKDTTYFRAELLPNATSPTSIVHP